MFKLLCQSRVSFEVGMLRFNCMESILFNKTFMSFTFILPELVLKITIKHKAARIRGNFPHLTASACFKYSRRCLNLKSVLKQASSPESWQLLLFSGVFCSILHSPRVLHFFYKGKGCRGLCQLVYLKLLIALPPWTRNDIEISWVWRRQQWQTQTESCFH